jgi:hypothetical protein
MRKTGSPRYNSRRSEWDDATENVIRFRSHVARAARPAEPRVVSAFLGHIENQQLIEPRPSESGQSLHFSAAGSILTRIKKSAFRNVKPRAREGGDSIESFK